MHGTPDALDLLDPSLLAHPWRAYDVLRAQAPVYEMPAMGFFVVTSHAGVAAALRDAEAFGADIGEPDLPGFLRTPEARAPLEERGIALESPLRGDAPDPRALRARLESCLAPRVDAAAPSVRAIARDLLGRLAGGGSCDFVAAFCAPFPLMVMADRLGLDLGDLAEIDRGAQAWSRALCYGLTAEQELEVATRRRELRDYLAARLAERRASPRGDLLCDLRRVAGSELQAAALAEELLVGGNDATGDALASGLLLLLRDPQRVDVLRAQPRRIDAFVEELLRLESPVAGVWRRSARDVELLGDKIPADRIVHLRIAAANRDPRVFGDPHRLDLERANAGEQLCFGAGPHRCVGASLARLQLRIGFEALLESWREMELAVPENRLAYLPSFTQRGLRALPVRFRAAGQG